MLKYKVVVRDYSQIKPTDTYLKMMERYYESPIVELDFINNSDKAKDCFDKLYRNNFSHFLNVKYHLIPQC